MSIQRWHHLPAVQMAFVSLADTEAILETVIAIQQIPAPTFEEQARGDAVQQRMVDMGLRHIDRDELGNVYGCRRGSTDLPALMVSAHLDTVFPADTDLRVRREDAAVYGPAIGDNSTGVAGLLHLAQAMQQHNLPNERDVWFVSNVGEEGMGDLRGMRAAVEHLRSRIDRVIVLEGCDFGTLHHEAIGVRRYKIEVDAPGGHSWGNFGSTSAIHVLVRLAAEIAELEVPLTPRTTFNLGVITGGTTVNTIAQHAEMLLDMRSVELPTLEALAKRVDGLIDRVAAEHLNATITATTVGNRPAGAIARDHPLVQAATVAYQTVGAKVNYQQGSTDANIPLSEGIAAVCIGLTDGGNAHRQDEYIKPANLGHGVQALLLLAMEASAKQMS